jgi:hypothetical protein
VHQLSIVGIVQQFGKSARIVPAEEDELSGRPKCKTPNEVRPEWKNSVCSSAIQDLRRIGIRSLEVSRKFALDCGSVDVDAQWQVPGRRAAGLPNGSRLSCGPQGPQSR